MWPVDRMAMGGHVWNFLLFTFGQVLDWESVCMTFNGVSMNTAWRGKSSSLCKSCWEALSGVEVALNLLSGHVNCIYPCHLQGTKAVPGFSEVSFSWPCFVVSPLNPFHVSDIHLADHIQAVYTSDYQWLCCPWGRSSIIVNQSPSEGMAAAFYRERWAFLINFCHSGTCKI